jgi:hypothetical protein
LPEWRTSVATLLSMTHTQRAVCLRCTAATREHKSTRLCSLGLGRTGKRLCPPTTAA